jgi:CHAT domain-containing protein
LWGKKLGKLEALRQAQLAVLRRYDPRAGGLRGPGERVPAADPEALARAREGRPGEERRLPAFYWAGFVLTGDWR